MKKILIVFFVVLFGLQSVAVIGVSKAETKSELPILDLAQSYSEGMAAVGIWEGYWQFGYIDKAFKLKIPFKYNQAEAFREGAAVVGLGKDKKTRKFGFIKKDGSLLHAITMDYAESFYKGFAIYGMKSSGVLKKGLIDAQGKIIIKPVYDYIDVYTDALHKGFIVVRNGDLFGYYNINTKKLVEPKYTSVVFLNDLVRLGAKVGQSEKVGLELYSGLVIEPKYDWLHYYSKIIKNVILKVEVNGKYGLLKSDGKFLLEPVYDSIMPYNDTMTHVKQGNLYGLLNSDGKWVTKIEFEEITAFINGAAYVKKNGKWGLLNIDGTYKLEPKFDQVFILRNEIQVIENGVKKLMTKEGNYRFDAAYEYLYPYASIPGAVKVKKDGKEVILNSEGKPLFKVDFDSISDFDVIEKNVAYITLNGKVGYMDRMGNYFVKPIYDGAFKDLKADYFHIKLNEKWGLVFSNGETIEPQFDGPLTFDEDFGVARINGKAAYIDRKGKLLSTLTFDQIHPFSDNRGRVFDGGKTKYLDEQGNLIKGEFAFGSDFKNGFALVYQEGKYRFINKSGDFAFSKTYNNGMFLWARDFSNNRAAFMDDTGLWGFIDNNGAVVINPKYTTAFGFFEDVSKDNTLAPVISNKKIGFIDVTGQERIKTQYEFVTSNDWNKQFSLAWKGGQVSSISPSGQVTIGVQAFKETQVYSNETSEGMTLIKAIDSDSGKELYGFMKADGQWLFKPQFDFALKFDKGVATVHKDGKQGVVTLGGEIKW